MLVNMADSAFQWVNNKDIFLVSQVLLCYITLQATVFNASARPVSLDVVVKLTLMSAHLSRAITVLPVWISRKATAVSVLQDTPVSTVRKRDQTVETTLARNVPCARTSPDTTTLLVSADQDILEMIVTSL